VREEASLTLRVEEGLMGSQVTKRGLATAFTDLSLAGLYLAFAWAHLRGFLDQPRASVILIVVFETLFAVFFLVRRPASSVSTSWIAWASTAAGTLGPLLLRPTSADDFWAGQLVQVAGLGFGIAGILSLNRSVGLLPANRGVRSSGAYRWVRHPLYSSYTVMHAGYLTSHLSGWNVAVFIVALAAQLVRIEGEERLLSQDPAYDGYKARTRWRLVPFVF
jgi:protein-S-isoprenylcysteine O-methyltransferase Ste14